MTDPKVKDKFPQKRTYRGAPAVTEADTLLDLPGLQFSESDLASINHSSAGENYGRILYTLACRCLAGSGAANAILEIGSGGSSITFAKALGKVGDRSPKLCSVEIDINKPSFHDVEVVSSLDVDWQVVHGDSLKVPLDKVPFAADMLYIDGDHGGDHAIGDYRKFAPLVRAGGLVVFDDYPTAPGVVNGVSAIVEILKSEGVVGKVLTYNTQDSNSFYVIQK